MKSFIAFALLIIGSSAFPNAVLPSNAIPKKLSQGIDFKNERLVTDTIASLIEDVSQAIKDIGLDPLYIESASGGYALPVPVLFSAEGVVEEFLFQGLSDIVINNLSYSVLLFRLRFDISLPLIEASLNKANLDIVLFGEDFNFYTAGSFAIKEININGDVRVSVGVISGISIRSIDLNFSLGGIDSELAVSVAGYDLSDNVNTFLGETIPNTLDTYSSEINELLEIVVTQIAEAIL